MSRKSSKCKCITNMTSRKSRKEIKDKTQNELDLIFAALLKMKVELPKEIIIGVDFAQKYGFSQAVTVFNNGKTRVRVLEPDSILQEVDRINDVSETKKNR